MKYELLLSSGERCVYSLVSSARAKYVRIKVAPPDQITLVVPLHVENKHAHTFVQEKKQWIEKTLHKLSHSPVTEAVLPETLMLTLTGEQWHVDYQKADTDSVQLHVHAADRRVTVSGKVDHKESVYYVLAQWLKDMARQVLPDMLDSLSVQYDLPYGRVTIRGQKTRWGSCSSSKNINLNYKLLFFPEPVVRYVLIHELCHTREMNHSNRFWMLVSQFDVDYQRHREILKKHINEFVPAGL